MVLSFASSLHSLHSVVLWDVNLETSAADECTFSTVATSHSRLPDIETLINFFFILTDREELVKARSERM